jgi:hypothetical protein
LTAVSASHPGFTSFRNAANLGQRPKREAGNHPASMRAKRRQKAALTRLQHLNPHEIAKITLFSPHHHLK